ncbi:alpha/beta fold hydrolase [Undibacter mobilis]|uniref:Alpha/beta hydrolase n=1 Tax=Undibacter mobilis TaxID=2292256 RepID=A0A371B1D5_9BRAD|nr:alpha/beta hydrolase [Undibacter mobilis]RDV01395.1 alpha/beta hydrolase [Undibacter mobilis]
MSDVAVSRFVTATDGLKLHVRDFAARDRKALPVICLPGLARTTDDFETLAAALAAGGRRVIALDYRGRGRSDYDPDPAKYSLPVELGDVITVLTALALEPAVFVGTSRGGLLTMLMAAVRPASVAGAVLNDIGPMLEAEGLVRIKGYVGKLPTPSSYDEAARVLARLFGAQFPNLSHHDWLLSARRTYKDKDGGLVVNYDVALGKALDDFDPQKPLPDLWPQFEALKDVPVMVIRGALSDLLSATTVLEMERRHPALETLVVPDQGHAPLLTESGTISRIAAFIGRCDAERTKISG